MDCLFTKLELLMIIKETATMDESLFIRLYISIMPEIPFPREYFGEKMCDSFLKTLFKFDSTYVWVAYLLQL